MLLLAVGGARGAKHGGRIAGPACGVERVCSAGIRSNAECTGASRTPTAFHHPAQGWRDAGAPTLGLHQEWKNPERVSSGAWMDTDTAPAQQMQPRWGCCPRGTRFPGWLVPRNPGLDDSNAVGVGRQGSWISVNSGRENGVMPKLLTASIGASRHGEHLRMLAGDLQQPESGAGGSSAAFLPTDRRHHRHIEHGGEDRLAHLQPCAGARHVLRRQRRCGLSRLVAAALAPGTLRGIAGAKAPATDGPPPLRPVTASRTCSTLRTSSPGLNTMGFFFMQAWKGRCAWCRRGPPGTRALLRYASASSAA